MIDEERIVSFINSLDSGKSQILSEIEKEAKADFVPIVRKEMQSLLRFLVASYKPDKILEVGCAVGFSSLLMWEASGKQAKITTIENYEKRIPIAKNNFKRAGAEEDITLLEGDATLILHEMEGAYPFIFMDAAKGQYPNMLPDVTRLLSKGGILVTDNILQDGDVCESRYAVTRRDRTIHSRVREYLYELTHSDVYETVILNIADGVTLSVRK